MKYLNIKQNNLKKTTAIIIRPISICFPYLQSYLNELYPIIFFIFFFKNLGWADIPVVPVGHSPPRGRFSHHPRRTPPTLQVA